MEENEEERHRRLRREASQRYRSTTKGLRTSRLSCRCWRVQHRDYFRDYKRRRYLEDPAFKLAALLRSRLREALKGQLKAATTMELLGCTTEQARTHIESTFQEGWTWENHGPVWHVDHEKPCVRFDLSDPAQQRECFHWTNLRAYPAFDNVSEGARMRAAVTTIG